MPERAILDRHLYVPHYLTLIANALVSRSSRDYLDRYGVGLNEARIIGVLGHVPGLTPAQLSAAMRMNKSIVSRSLAAMVDHGLVRQAGGPRAPENRLTVPGYALHDNIVAAALAREAELLAGFSGEEKDCLLGLLRRLLQNANRIRQSGKEAVSPDL